MRWQTSEPLSSVSGCKGASVCASLVAPMVSCLMQGTSEPLWVLPGRAVWACLGAPREGTGQKYYCWQGTSLGGMQRALQDQQRLGVMAGLRVAGIQLGAAVLQLTQLSFTA